ncbi:hypothetical protein ACFLYV_00245 [Chloroflexota bacterium]
MTIKKPSKMTNFVECDEEFVRRLAKDIGCNYFKANERTFNLNQNNSDIPEANNIFAWVHKESHDYFWVATRKIWVEKAKAAQLLLRKKVGSSSFPHYDKQGDGVCLNARDDYNKTVRALKLINKMVLHQV